jgi:filamentous hemagglutinin
VSSDGLRFFESQADFVAYEKELFRLGRTPLLPAPSADRRFFTQTVEFGGNKVYQRNDLIDPNLVDARGRTNLQRMQDGLAPLGPDGESINVHHMLQTQDSPLVELTETFHQDNFRVIHINMGRRFPSGIDRNAFNAWKRAYWTFRANDFTRGAP